MKGSVAGKPYVIIIELVLAVLALVIIWHVFSKFFGFGAGILQGFIESILGQAGKAAVRGIFGLVGFGNPILGGGLAGCGTVALAGAAIGSVVPGIGTAVGAAIGCGIGSLLGSLFGWWSTT